jgi:DNA-binding cell septation regulator SpoVG
MAPKTQKFTVREFKHFQKNTLQAFLSLELTSGMVLHDCTLHEKNGSRWIGMPARQYEKSAGEKSWMPLIEFASKEHREKFQAAALAAIRDYLQGAQ